MHAMRQVVHPLRAATSLWVAVLLTVTFGAIPASAGENSRGSQRQGDSVLSINETAVGHVTVKEDSLTAGVITVNLKSRFIGDQGHDVTVFSLCKGTTLEQFRTKLTEAFNPKTPPSRVGWIVQVWINQHVTFYGGFQSQSIGQLTYQVVLREGSYYAGDIAQLLSKAAVDRFWVKGDSHAQLPRPEQSLNMVVEDRFVLNAEHNRLTRGWLRIANHTSDLHFALFQPVKAGTTDKQVTAMFSGGPDVSRPGDPIATGVISPGVKINLWLKLSNGAYVVACFMPDKDTGMEHAMPPMNMHLVVNVRGESDR